MSLDMDEQWQEPSENGSQKRPGQIIAGWWDAHIEDRESSAARGLAARLRRAGPVEALSERQVHALARALELRDPDRLMRIVRVLTHIRSHETRTFAQQLGRAGQARGDNANAMDARFQRLLRAQGDELATGLIRALPLIKKSCNVAALGEDLFYWSDKTRMRWSFHYFGAEAPETTPETTQ
ncbi:MAG: type I-E CRISPR-associated protein Cse2/CasB [Mangrovicoccus sp.]